MIRFYANQAGYLPKGRKIAVLAQENRADEMEKMQDKKVSLWNEKGEQTAVKQAVYAGVDESAEDKVWHIDFSDLTEEGTVTDRKSTRLNSSHPSSSRMPSSA